MLIGACSGALLLTVRGQTALLFTARALSMGSYAILYVYTPEVGLLSVPTPWCLQVLEKNASSLPMPGNLPATCSLSRACKAVGSHHAHTVLSGCQRKARLHSPGIHVALQPSCLSECR